TIADMPEDPHASPFGEEDTEGAQPEGEMSDDPPEPEASAPRVGSIPGGYLTLRDFRDKAERQYIVDTLKLTGWNISRTAVVLGVERTNLHKKIRAYQIKRGEG